MLLTEESSVSIPFPKTLLRPAVEAFWITLLSSKGNRNHCDLNEKIFIIIFAPENLMFDMISTCSGVNIAAFASLSRKR